VNLIGHALETLFDMEELERRANGETLTSLLKKKLQIKLPKKLRRNFYEQDGLEFRIGISSDERPHLICMLGLHWAEVNSPLELGKFVDQAGQGNAPNPYVVLMRRYIVPELDYWDKVATSLILSDEAVKFLKENCSFGTSEVNRHSASGGGGTWMIK
jgi:hypothetical protein